MKYLICFLTFLFSVYSFSQTKLSEKEAFIFFMKAYNHKPLDNTNNRSVNFGQYRWIDLYILKFCGYEYNQVKNDEFKIQSFFNRINSELNHEIESVNHNKIYTQTIKASIGKFNFEDESFPIYYSSENFKGVEGNLQGFRIEINDILNKEDVMMKLPMTANKAESFINSRKSNNGKVNREVYLKFHFKVTSLNTIVYSPKGGVNGYNKEDLSIVATKIEVLKNKYDNNALHYLKILNEDKDYVQDFKSKKESELRLAQEKQKKEKQASDYKRLIEKKEKEKQQLKDKLNYAIKYKKFSHGLAAIEINGKYGFINEKGDVVIPLRFDRVSSFKEGLAWIKLNGKYGYINNKGKLVIPIKYDNAMTFRNGMARVEINYKPFYINTKGLCVKDCSKQ